jgi:amino acid transporter
MLEKRITLFGLLFTAVGGIVGSGWLFGPYFAAQMAGPASLVSWVLGGLMMMLIAITFAELATMFPEAGGMVRFAYYSHGPFASFSMAWIGWLAAAMVAPIETLAALQYLGNYFPSLVHIAEANHQLSGIGIVWAALIMLTMCALNFFGVSWFTKSNNWIVALKLLIPIMVIIFLLSSRFSGSNFFFHGSFFSEGIHGALAALPSAGVVLSFIGYSPAIQLAAETKNPGKSIPIAIIGALAFAIILYFFLQLAFIGALDPASFQHGWSNLTFAGDSGPVAGLLASVGVVWFLKVIYFGAVFSPLSTGFIYTASTARVNLAMSRNGFMPPFMTKLNRFYAPYVAILVNFALGMLAFLPFPGWQAMVGFFVACFVLAYIAGPVACAAMRNSLPDRKRPFRVPFYRVLCPVAFYACSLIIFWSGWSLIWKMILLVLVGYALLLMVYSRKLYILEISRGLWLVPYLLGMAVLSYLGSFGGKNIIHFGWDFLAIALFSIVIFWVALKSAELPSRSRDLNLNPELDPELNREIKP